MDEAVYGADYLMRSLSPQDYFYMTVFSYFKKDPNARRVVGLLANSQTPSDYQCAYREGGGMANSIVGSGIILGLASLMGIPVGIAAGVLILMDR